MKNKNCIYCENENKSEHFICEVCGTGMCEECYVNQKEHDGHYNEICESADDKEYDLIVKKIGHEPAYLCEKCLNKILT